MIEKMCGESLLYLVILMLLCITDSIGISELKPSQIINYQSLSNQLLSRYSFMKDDGYFHYIPGHSSPNEIYLGARNKLFSVPVPVVSEAREVLEWKPTTQCREPRYMCSDKKPSKLFACGNHIRLVLAYSNKEKPQTHASDSSDSTSALLTVCGSNGGHPQCRLYRRDRPKWAIVKENIKGEGIVSSTLCPDEKNPFYYKDETKRVFVSTFSLRRPSFVLFNTSEDVAIQLYLRGSPFLKGKNDVVAFHSTFRYQDKIYILFNEEAYESHYNSASILTKERKKASKMRKRRFARVARVCENDQGAEFVGRKQNFFSTYFKARLLCQSPEGFTFDYLVAVSEINSSDAEPVIHAVFAADDGLTRAHAICAFRASQIEHGIRKGAFVEFRMAEKSNYLERITPSLSIDKFLSCHDHKTSPGVAGFAHRHPLKTDPVANMNSYPWIAFTANKYNITTIVTESSAGHEVVFLGTDTGLLLKLAALPRSKKPGLQPKFNVVESIQVFPPGTVINSLLLRQNRVIAISDHEMKAIQLQRCKLRKTCRDCMALGDPHCSWDVLTQRCSPNAKKFSSVVQGMKYCRKVETKPISSGGPVISEALVKNRTAGKPTSSGISASYVSIVAVTCIIIGFVIGGFVAFVLLKRFGDRLPTHLIREVRRRNNENLGNEKPNAGPRGVSNILQDKLSPKMIRNSNEYDSFLEHRSPPSSVPLDKKLNNEVIKNNLMASLNHHKSIDNFL